MSEDYFLYYEEIDWFTRAGDRFPPCLAAHAHLYHREGSAIGSPGWQRKSSAFADHHVFRSRLLFMRKHFAARLPLTLMALAVEGCKCLVRGQMAHLRGLARALLRPHPVWRPGP